MIQRCALSFLRLSLLSFSTLALFGCGPDNVGECDAAQDALNAAYSDCGNDANADLRCDAYADYTGDCTPYFKAIAESATCTEAGVVDYDNSAPCTA